MKTQQIASATESMSNVVPDGFFYYSLSIVLAGALIFVVWKFANNVSAMLKELKEEIGDQKVKNATQDEQIKGLQNEVFGQARE